METKTCSRCREVLSVEDFGLQFNNRRGKSYRASACKACRGAERRADEAERQRAAARRRDRYKNDAEYRARRLATHQKWRYGITAEERAALLDAQGGRCAACGADDPGSRRGWVLDHDHACCDGGKTCGECVRGLLCQGCNLALGHAKDSPARLLALASYLMAGMTPGGNPNMGATVSRYQEI